MSGVDAATRDDQPTGPDDPARPGQPGQGRRELRSLLELTALCGFAIAQPLLDITGRSPDFFLFHGAGTVDIVLLVAVITLAPPLLLWGAGAATALVSPRVRRVVHLLTLGGLCLVLAVEAGKQVSTVRGVPLALLGLVAAAGMVAAYLRWVAAGQVLRLAAVGPLVSVTLFVFASPTSPVLLAGGSGAATAGRPIGEHPPIVMIIFDELPQVSLLDDTGKIDAARFPNFAALAGGSTWYRNATAVSGYTPYAVPSMLTGRYPTRAAAPHYSQYPNNLFTLLSGTYQMKVHESVVNLCPPDGCAAPGPAGPALPVLLGESVGLLRQVVSPRDSRQNPEAAFAEPTVRGAGGPVDEEDEQFRWREMKGNQPIRFRQFVDGLRPSAEPTLHFLHLLLPHRPFRYLASGARYEEPAGGLEKQGDWWAQLGHQRHLAQARYADRLLGLAMAAMRESGLYDDALLLVTADHGIAFTPARTYKRNIDTAQHGAAAIGWVPHFVKAPGQKTAAVDGRNLLQLDVLPTVADYAGVEVPWRVDGISVRRPARTTTDKPFAWAVGRRIMLDAGRWADAVVNRPAEVVGVPEPPLQDLVGRAVGELATTTATGGPASVTASNRDRFRDVDPGSGTVPALVWGDTSAAAGRHLAIAVNGTIGAVVPVLPDAPDAPDAPRFAGLVADDSLFVAGANRLEFYLVTPDGAGLERTSG